MTPRPALSTSLGFEDKLWVAADLLRGSLDPAEYKHVLLGLLFLKSASTSGRFTVPERAQWSTLVDTLEAPALAKRLDTALEALERANAHLSGALPPRFHRAGLEERSLAQLLQLVASLLPSEDNASQDTLGRVYEYLIGRFASAEGRGGGEFYTPACVVQLLVELLQPFEGSVYDPCCGSGGMFVQSLRFIAAHGGDSSAVRVYGQESNPGTWRMAQMNLALRGIRAELGERPADTLHENLHPSLVADTVLANPPFNISRWGAEALRGDPRWSHGLPPDSNANFAWLQHILHHLSPTGTAGVVLSNGSLSGTHSGEGTLRRALIEADLVEGVVALPEQLFYATAIPACVWLLAPGKGRDAHRDRRGEILFVDASRWGHMETRTHRVLSQDEITRIAGALRRWRDPRGGYQDEPGFCRSAPISEVLGQEGILTPGRYVGAPPVTEASDSTDLALLIQTLREQQQEAAVLDQAIEQTLASLERD